MSLLAKFRRAPATPDQAEPGLAPQEPPRQPESLVTRVPLARDPTPEDHDALAPALEGQVLRAIAEGRGGELLRELDALSARRSLAEYCRQAWHVVEPSTTLEWNWHHQLVCDVLQGMLEDWERSQDDEHFRQRVRRAVFNLPPGSSKSRLLAVFMPTWMWTRRPGWKLIALSVNQDAAHRDARDSRALIRSDWYQRSFRPEWTLKDDQDAISSYANTAGGSRLSRAQGSEIVGLRADLVLADDPNNPHEAESKKARDEVNELWDTNIYSRVNDMRRSLWIGVQQRTNAGDWSGYVLDSQGVWDPVSNPEGWLHVVLPAEFELARRTVTPWGSDLRTTEGESLHLARLPPDVLRAERQRFGAHKYAGQMQQRPTLVEGGRVKRAYWGFCRLAAGVRPEVDEIDNGRPRPAGTDPGSNKVPHVIRQAHHRPGWDLDWLVISVDPAAKKTERGSNYGMLVIGGQGNRRFVLDDRTCRGDFEEILQVLRELIVLWRPDRLLIEAKAAGPDILTTLQYELAGAKIRDADGRPVMVVLEPIEPGNSDKEMRLDACIPWLQNGFVYLLDGAPWLDDFVEELSTFPAGTRSDRVDALSQCLNHIRDTEDSLPSW